jgi:ATP-binding cassette subfamily F protein 3
VFEITYANMTNLKSKQHDAQMAKIEHMQEFVDKFRYNAKRASLVQSRIKAIQKETLDLETPEEEEKPFSFFFPDCGQLGQPVIKVDNVTFAYPNKSPLFRNVDLAIDQTSRIGINIIIIIIINYY